MNDALRMQISAFVDGELPENENELLLRRLSQDAALRQQVAQYLAIGRLIRRDHEVPGMSELRDRIAAALGEEPVQHRTETAVPANRFIRPAFGAAIAATVAVMAILGIRQIYGPPDNQEIVAVEQFPTESLGTITPDDDELLKQFYLQHDPRLVTLQLQFDLKEQPAEDDEKIEEEIEEESQD
jgi:negative regulator of sigma E activity